MVITVEAEEAVVATIEAKVIKLHTRVVINKINLKDSYKVKVIRPGAVGVSVDLIEDVHVVIVVEVIRLRITIRIMEAITPMRHHMEVTILKINRVEMMMGDWLK